MAFIESSLPPIKVWVRDGFFYNDPDNIKYKDRYTKAILVSIRCNEGSAALFQVITEHGMMRDKLPISAICWKQPADYGEWSKYPFHYLQLWDCFSKVFSIVTLNYVYNARVDIMLKNRQKISGNYMFTIQWGANENTGTDMTLAEDPAEHKSHHFFCLDNGMFAIQPNNRVIKWHEPSFVSSEPFSGEPWKVNTLEFSCEQEERWVTDESDNYYYEAGKLDNISEQALVEYANAYKEMQEFDEQPQYIKDYILKKARRNMNKAKKKLAAPKPKKGAKKKTTYLYGGTGK